jgi:hypothetical protein
MTSITPARRSGGRNRDIPVRDWAVWVLGLFSGLGVAALDDTAGMVLPAMLLLAGTVPLSVLTLRRVLLRRRRVLVWEEPSWQSRR